ncbi:MAG: ribbon-helix-helix protein, CopG family [bacterium]|nr:ribbon-helix-helix protein, CopG family [bacterium]
MTTSTISTRINSEIAEKLDKIARATNRSRSFVAAEAIQQYVEDQSWQIEAIKEGIREADNGNFASDDDVKKVFSKWGGNAD